MLNKEEKLQLQFAELTHINLGYLTFNIEEYRINVWANSFITNNRYWISTHRNAQLSFYVPFKWNKFNVIIH